MEEKLIELIKPVLECLPWGEITSHTAQDIAKRLIENGVTLDKVDNNPIKWIPVGERLPEQVKEVLAFSAEFGEYQIGWLAFSDEEQCGVVCVGDGIELYKVTHWTPLPEPPRGE